jgi:hypothetical protein
MPQVQAIEPPEPVEGLQILIADPRSVKVDDGHAVEEVVAQRAGKPRRCPGPFADMSLSRLGVVVINDQTAAALDQDDGLPLTAGDVGVPCHGAQ